MSKRGGAPAALMRGRREGCEKRLPRQCEALERSRSRTLSGASSTMKARERGETCPMRRNAPHAPKRPNAQTPKRPNAQTPKRPTSAARSPQHEEKRSTLNTPQGPLFSHRIQRGANAPVANRASERYIQARLPPGSSAPRLCYSASPTIIFGHLPSGAFVSFPASFPRQYKRPRCPGAACRGIGSGALRFEPCASVDGHTYRSRRLP